MLSCCLLWDSSPLLAEVGVAVDLSSFVVAALFCSGDEPPVTGSGAAANVCCAESSKSGVGVPALPVSGAAELRVVAGVDARGELAVALWSL